MLPILNIAFVLWINEFFVTTVVVADHLWGITLQGCVPWSLPLLVSSFWLLVLGWLLEHWTLPDKLEVRGTVFEQKGSQEGSEFTAYVEARHESHSRLSWFPKHEAAGSNSNSASPLFDRMLVWHRIKFFSSPPASKRNTSLHVSLADQCCLPSRYLCGLDWSICGWHSELDKKLLLLYYDCQFYWRPAMIDFKKWFYVTW